MKKLMIFLFSIFTLLAGQSLALAADIKLGVLANRGELQATTRWDEFGKYLSGETGKTVRIVPLPPAKVNEAVAGGEVDFVFSHSPHTVFAEEKAGAKVLATLNTKAGPRFGGVIVTKKGKGITSAADLKGKKVMSLKFKAAAGAYIFQTHYLMKQGIDPHKDFASLRAGKKQDDLVLAVKAGLIDAAFVRTGLLEAMQREGKIKMDEFVIVDAKTVTDFPFALTTDLYPEWCLSALPSAGSADVSKVKAALLKMNAGMPAAKTANIKGFVEPLPLDGIKDALKTLKIAPYNS